MKIVSEDSETGGHEAFIVIDAVTIAPQRYMFIIESKKSLEDAKHHSLLALKDMGDCNGERGGLWIHYYRVCLENVVLRS